MRGGIGASLVAALLLTTTGAIAEEWPQFRGVNSSGVSASDKKLPAEIGPESNVLWRVSTPPGHSSPIVSGERIFFAAVRDERLLTVALDAADGKQLWAAEAAYEKLEEIHQIGSHAQCTPATDGERVVSFFGSSGMYCYTRDGKQLWKRPMGPFNNEFGAGTSPIIVDNMVILCQDHDTDSFLLAVNKETGKTIWRTDRSEFPRNYCSPIVWEVEGKKQIVVAATLRVVGYDAQTGRELWTVRGLSRSVCMTPVVGPDGVLYVAGWARGGDVDERISVEPFDTVAAARDANKNGTIERAELEKGGDIERRYPQVDLDKSGTVTKEEYEYYRGLFDAARNVVLAVRPGGSGDVTRSHVVWEYTRYVPFCASPLAYRGLVFTVKDGGILNALDAATGEPKKVRRVRGTGNYYASPVAGDGKVYLADQRGVVSVVSAEGQWRELHTAQMEEEVYGTPAIVDGRIYLRTEKHLYCFGLSAAAGARR